MATVSFDACSFRGTYPQFDNLGTYPDTVLDAYFATASLYIDSNLGMNEFLSDAQLALALNLMTAHLAGISAVAASGQAAGLMNSATVDKISVSLTPPPVRTQFDWWLSLTPYGQSLLALLQMVSAGGIYLGARNELSAFRTAGGYING